MTNTDLGPGVRLSLSIENPDSSVEVIPDVHSLTPALLDDLWICTANTNIDLIIVVFRNATDAQHAGTDGGGGSGRGGSGTNRGSGSGRGGGGDVRKAIV